jgi:hypothetical protein
MSWAMSRRSRARESSGRKHLDVDPALCGCRDDRTGRARDVAGRHPLGSVEDRPGGAEARGEDDPSCLRVPLGEGRHVVDVGAAEAVDRLIWVGGDAEVPGTAERVEHLDLNRSRVLVLVDNDVLDPIRQLCAWPIGRRQHDESLTE